MTSSLPVTTSRVFMKATDRPGLRLGFFASAFSLALVLLGCDAVRAQNLLRNPGFESPLGPDNWSVVYAYGGPSDLSIADRSTFASRGGGNYGAHLRSIHDGLYHAYFSQTVTNLTPGASYIVSGYMKYWEYTFELNSKFDVYFEAVGGQGTNSTPNITAMDDSNLKTNAVYRLYSVTNTATVNGKIEVRLQINRHGTITCCDKLYYVNAMWDDMSLALKP
jgi:hypothetical protein